MNEKCSAAKLLWRIASQPRGGGGSPDKNQPTNQSLWEKNVSHFPWGWVRITTRQRSGSYPRLLFSWWGNYWGDGNQDNIWGRRFHEIWPLDFPVLLVQLQKKNLILLRGQTTCNLGRLRRSSSAVSPSQRGSLPRVIKNFFSLCLERTICYIIDIFFWVGLTWRVLTSENMKRVLWC